MKLLHTGEVYKTRLAKPEGKKKKRKKASTRSARHVISTDHLGKEQNGEQGSNKSYTVTY